MKFVLILLMSFLVLSCGKSKTNFGASSSMSESDSLTIKKEFESQKNLDDITCIDTPLFKELGETDKIDKILDQGDINFCNGLRIRVKIFKISNGDVRAYGFAESSSGRRSCLREGADFKRGFFYGSEGTLVGDKIKISLGGHQYDNKGRLMKSSFPKARHVTFDIASYKGEIGFFENEKLKCWATH